MHQYEGAWLKIEVFDGLLKGMLELLHRLEAALEDVGVNGGKVIFTLLELAGSNGEKVDCVKFRRNVQNKKDGECDVERKDGFNAVGHVEGGVTSCFVGCCMICTEHVRGNGGPFQNVAFTCFDN